MYQHIDSAIKPHIGKKLEAITRIADDKVMIEFEDGAKLKASVSGDCCSHSIFYEIEMPDELRGATLEGVCASCRDESVTTADDEATALAKVKASGMDFNPEENSVWNVVLKTDRGNALIRHINSSNGYYDGDVYFEAQ